MKYLLLATGCLFMAACQSSIEPRLQPGQFSLVSYNGKPVPANLEELPDRSGNRSGCWIVVTNGQLTIDTAATGFEYSFETRDSCGGSVLSERVVNGSIAQSDGKIVFVAPGDLRFEVELGAKTIMVHHGNVLLGFQRI